MSLSPDPLTGTAVPRRIASRSETEADGYSWRRMAQAPATKGADIEVPSSVAVPPPGTAEVIATPGAIRSTSGPTGEKLATWSLSSVAPTLIALEMQAGA